ncbi:hypothetical protein [Vulcanisaeta thermophila]|uniref:hypothetical protein n=1 Tax=Vulcanisaeta thermophila TaxID=867917 RepID=UPI000853DB89|nr:hypothetical protein [Vulcanisaeta thermophila]
MGKYTLILMYVDSEETLDLVRRGLGDIGLYLTPTVVITWRERRDVDKRLSRAKAHLMDAMEKGFKGEFSYAVIELTEDQYRGVRQLVVIRLIKEVESMISRGEALLARIRSARDVNRVKGALDSFNRRYRWVVQLHEVFDVKHDLLRKLMDLTMEMMNEYERRVR